MTQLVSTETGEILDAEAAEMRASFICSDLDHAADTFETAMDRMRAAIRDRDDLALGYRSPGDYLTDRFGSRLARLGVDLRREVVRELTEAGLSVRAIATVTESSVGTVHNDQSQVFRTEHLLQTPVASETGAASLAEANPQDTPDEEQVTAAAAGPVSDDSTASTPEAETPAIPRPPVVGIDGKTYSRPAPAPKPVLDGSAAEYANAETASMSLSRAISKLLEFQHPNMRDAMRRNWSMASLEVPPTPRRDVTPEQMRVAAHGLLSLADEWGDQ